jgi:hypothetical protein
LDWVAGAALFALELTMEPTNDKLRERDGDVTEGDERATRLRTLFNEKSTLIERFSIATASATERNDVERRLLEISDEENQILGLSEEVIAEINAETEAEVKAIIKREVEIGLALFQKALRGDKKAIAKLKKGSLEFAVAIGEGALRPEDLAKLPLAIEFAQAGSKAGRSFS